MTFKEAIQKDFMDKDGLVTPWPYNNNSSNNGFMYLGEFVTLLCLNKEFNKSTDLKLLTPVYNIEIEPGLLKRSSTNNVDYEAIDDYLGILTGIYFSGLSILAEDILYYGIKNLGFYNNVNPSKINWTSFLFRFPQLIAVMFWASNRKVWFPLNLITALIIATSCIGAKQSDGTDNFRLSWLLIQVAKRESWLCNIASKLWYARLKKVFGNMGNVYKVYYSGLPGQDHPFVTAMRKLEE